MSNPLESNDVKYLHKMALGFAHDGQLEVALQLFKQAIAKNDDPFLHDKLTSDRIITEFLITTRKQYKKAQLAKRALQISFILFAMGLLVLTYRPAWHYLQQKGILSEKREARTAVENPIAMPQPIVSTPQPSFTTPKPSLPPKYQTITGLDAPVLFEKVKLETKTNPWSPPRKH